MPTLEQVCKRLFADSSWFLKCIVGALLLAVPVAWFFSFGYLYELADRARRGEELELPEWEDWGRLFSNGVAAFVIVIILGLAPVVLAGLLVKLVILLLSLIGMATVSNPHPLIFVGPLVYLPLVLAVVLAAPLSAAGLYQYQRREEYADAFRPRVLLSMLRSTKGYFWVPTLALMGFVFLGLPLLTFAPFVGLACIWPFYLTFFRHVEQSRRTTNSR